MKNSGEFSTTVAFCLFINFLSEFEWDNTSVTTGTLEADNSGR